MQAGYRIYSIAVSRDGRWIVSGDYGKKVIVWNAVAHEKVLHKEHKHSVFAVDISSDCTKVIAASYTYAGTARVFGITSGTQLLPPLPHSWIRSVKFSPDGSRFATASIDSSFRIYNTYDGKVLFDSGHHGSTHATSVATPLAWSSDGQELFIAGTGKITCFNVSNSSSSEWPIHETRSDASIASNGRFVARSAGSSVSLWDCVSHKQIGGTIPHTTVISCIALSPSGGYLACGFSGGKITIHNLRDVLPSEYFVTGFPLVQVSGETLASWSQDDPTNTEMLLSEEIMSTSNPSHYLLANRALIRARLKHVALAIEDGRESLRVQPSPIGYIAIAVSLLGQGDQEGALRSFDLAFHDCKLDDIRLLLLLKAILVFESGNQEDAITRVELLAARANSDNDDNTIYLYTQVLGVMYMKTGSYERAIPLIEHAKNLAPKDKRCPSLTTVSLIFGWSLDKLDVVAQQRLCETLYAEGRTAEAVEIFLDMIKAPEVVQGSKVTADWITDFT